MRCYFNLFVVLTLATLSRAQVRGWEGTLVLRSSRYDVLVALDKMNQEITRLNEPGVAI
jgi:hypothetical protein